ncbi:MAG: MOSC domain-containing protein [Candidatus Riflebacteria bacterium]|nr:MOSC domain-containing protein [Candidatus Riflebacteria bacterium]
MAKVRQIFISCENGGEILEQSEVFALAGCGLVGDRNFVEQAGNANKKAITLQSSEAIQACNEQLGTDFAVSAFRRNIITEGVELNELLGKKFYIGKVLLHAWELCQPCKYLQNLLGANVLAGLRDRGGLRAEILEGGVITTGLPIVIAEQGK